MTRNGPCTATRHDPTYNAYHAGCRCPGARDAWRLYNKRRREGRHTPLWVDPTGTRRRLEALAAIGWPTTTIAKRLGLERSQVYTWRNPRRRYITTGHARAVADLYDQLWDTTGPSPRCRVRAANAGHPPPMAWDDQSIDDPTAQPQLGRPGRGRIDLADITHLQHFGWTRRQIAEHLSVDPESITTALRRKAS